MKHDVDWLVLVPDDIDLSRSPLAGHFDAETYVLGAFNPGLTRLANGNLLMMVRVAEALRHPIVGGKVHTIRWENGQYIPDGWPLDLANSAPTGSSVSRSTMTRPSPRRMISSAMASRTRASAGSRAAI
jgi:hypothetical protein